MFFSNQFKLAQNAVRILKPLSGARPAWKPIGFRPFPGFPGLFQVFSTLAGQSSLDSGQLFMRLLHGDFPALAFFLEGDLPGMVA